MTPPHSIDAEKAILGAVLLTTGKAAIEIAGTVSSVDFYHPAHAAIFDAMVSLDKAHKPIDSLTVSEQMQSMATANILTSSGGIAYLDELSAAVVTLSNLAYYAGIVHRTAERRVWGQVARKIASEAVEDSDDDDFFVSAEKQWTELTNRPKAGSATPLKPLLKQVIQAVGVRFEHKGTLTGITSGFGSLDVITAGFQPSTLNVIAARPSIGKTAFAGNIAVNCKTPCLIFSLEMSAEALVERMVVSHGSVNAGRLRSGELDTLDWAHFMSAGSDLSDRTIWIDDTPSIALQELRSRARRWFQHEAKGKPALVVIDYLQLVRSPQTSRSANREQEIAEVSRGLKALAKEIRCPVIALAQLNRGVESRGEKRPGLADLRESGAIEQDADVVAFIYRDEVYDKESKEKGIAEIIVGKQRCGPTGMVKLKWRPEYCRFEDMPS